MELPITSSRQLPGIFHFTNDTISCVITVGHICVLIREQVQLDWKIETFLPHPRRDCMKGDEMETKKIGGSVNLMVSHPWFVHFKSSGCFFFTPNLIIYLILHFPHNDDSFSATETQNFYKSEVNKEDMYIRYIHKLCDLHLQAEDFTGNVRRRLFFEPSAVRLCYTGFYL